MPRRIQVRWPTVIDVALDIVTLRMIDTDQYTTLQMSETVLDTPENDSMVRRTSQLAQVWIANLEHDTRDQICTQDALFANPMMERIPPGTSLELCQVIDTSHSVQDTNIGSPGSARLKQNSLSFAGASCTNLLSGRAEWRIRCGYSNPPAPQI